MKKLHIIFLSLILLLQGCSSNSGSTLTKYLNACKLNDEQAIVKLSLEDRFLYITDWEILQIEDVGLEQKKITELVEHCKQDNVLNKRRKNLELQKGNLIKTIIEKEYCKLTPWNDWLKLKDKEKVVELTRMLREVSEGNDALYLKFESASAMESIPLMKEYNSNTDKSREANKEIKKYFITENALQENLSKRDDVVKLTDEIMSVEKERIALLEEFRLGNRLFNLWIEDKLRVEKLTNVKLDEASLSGKYTLSFQEAYCQLSIQSELGLILSKRHKIQLVKFDCDNYSSGWKIWKVIDMSMNSM